MIIWLLELLFDNPSRVDSGMVLSESTSVCIYMLLLELKYDECAVYLKPIDHHRIVLEQGQSIKLTKEAVYTKPGEQRFLN